LRSRRAEKLTGGIGLIFRGLNFSRNADIGQVAKLTGATPKAIRHYEAIGLMAPPKRSGKYRCFSDADVKAIRMIKSAQKYGFKLSELESIVKKARSDNSFPYSELIDAIQKKRQQIRSEINQLTAADDGLAQLSEQLKSRKCSC
jgi:MerR family copper efflux transcriptional regulator